MMKNLLTTLTNNLNTLLEQEAAYGAEAPRSLLDQIENLRTAIDLIRQANADDLSRAALLEKLADLNLDLPGDHPAVTIDRDYTPSDAHLPYRPPELPPHFVEREALGTVKEMLLASSDTNSSLIVLHGPEGIGKTGLAVALAHEQAVMTHFHDGILWARLGPDATEETVEAWQAAWGRALGDDLRSLPGPASKAARLRELLSARTCLVIVDDVWPATDLTPLLLGGANCRTLVTTRQSETVQRYEAKALHIEHLSTAESLELLSHWAERDLTGDSAELELVQRLGRRPLTLALAGAQLLDGVTMPDLLRPLQARQGELAGLDLKAPETFEACLALMFDLSFQRLPAADRRRLAQLSVTMASASFDEAAASAVWNTPGPHIPLDGVRQKPSGRLNATEARVGGWEALVDQTPSQIRPDSPTRSYLRRLTRSALLVCLKSSDPTVTLVEVSAQYTLHPVLTKIAPTHLPKTERNAAIQRHMAYCLRIAQNSAHDWQATELAAGQIRAAWGRVTKSHDKHIFDFVEAMRPFFDRLGLWLEKLAWHQTALELARIWGTQEKQAVNLNSIGCIYYLLGRSDEALHHLQQALTIQQELGGQAGMTVVLNNIRRIYRDRDDPDQEFQQHFQQALAIQQKLGDKPGLAVLLNNIAQIYQDRADLIQALRHYRQALELNQELDNTAQVAKGLTSIGRIYQIRGDLSQALHHYQAALTINRDLNNKPQIATSLWNIGDVYLKQDRLAEAETVLQEAVTLFELEGGPDANVARQWLEEARRARRRQRDLPHLQSRAPARQVGA
jgi:tetratricopeptide (TPR) repeat protein